jgi:hypothetical protein
MPHVREEIANMGARQSAGHYRDMAEHFRTLAEIEPLASLRRHLKRLAAQHDEMAEELEQQDVQTIAAE